MWIFFVIYADYLSYGILTLGLRVGVFWNVPVMVLNDVLTVCSVSKPCVNSDKMMDALDLESSKVFKSLGIFSIWPNEFH